MRAEWLFHRLSRLYTLDPAAGEGPLGELADASVGFQDGHVIYVGPSAHAPEAENVFDGRGHVGFPGLVDPHTHAVWAGSRSEEFRRRLAGESYAAILEGGGGILSTVAATRAASEDALADLCARRLRPMLGQGVTTVEVKSGYGLAPDAECKQLRAAARAGVAGGPRVVPTFLGAHTVPAESRADRAAYVRAVIEEQLPRCAPLASSVDVFCDRGAFSVDEAVAVLEAGRAAGLRVRAHAEQIAHTGIAARAAELGATALDHLEHVDEVGIAAMAAHGTVAVLLPGAMLYLRDAPPPVAAFRAAGVPMAIGTDLNPGSSPVHDLWTCATLGCLLMGLTIEESLIAITHNAGRALGRPELGWIGIGSAADLAVFAPPPGEPPDVASFVQHMGARWAAAVVRDGRRVHWPR